MVVDSLRNAGAPALLALASACSAATDSDAELGVYDPVADASAAPAPPETVPTSSAPPTSSTPEPPPPLATVQPAASAQVYDPNVQFDWPETVASGPCLPGAYSGQFSCQIDLTGGLLPPGVYTGPVTFTLAESSAGEFLEISSGTLQGATGFITFNAQLAGQLDCSTNQFRADALNGMFPGGTFSGILDGQLDRATQTLTGAWSMTAMGFPPCVGPWSVTLQP